MKKRVAVALICAATCFLIPIIFTRPLQREQNITVKKEIRLFRSETGKVETMDFNEYLKGVLIGEVPATYEIEALKAQALVARTYSIYKMKNNNGVHDGADMCDDINHCQAYKTKEYAFDCWEDGIENEKWEKIDDAVESTSGEIITYNGEVINAFFHAHSGGRTEDVKFLWGRSEIPYLKSVQGFESYLFEDEKVIKKDQFVKLVEDKFPNYDKIYNMEILEHTDSGRVDKVKIGNIEMLGTEARTLFSLRSTNFKIELKEDEIVFKTVGYGHGVGMSQEGANQMAISGYNYNEIIKHYYTGVEIVKNE